MFSNVRLKDYTSIFLKVYIFSFRLEIPFIGVFEFKNVDFDQKRYGNYLGVYKSILPKMSTLAIERKIAYLWVLKYQKAGSDYETSLRLTIQGHHVDLVINVKFGP